MARKNKNELGGQLRTLRHGRGGVDGGKSLGGGEEPTHGPGIGSEDEAERGEDGNAKSYPYGVTAGETKRKKWEPGRGPGRKITVRKKEKRREKAAHPGVT